VAAAPREAAPPRHAPSEARHSLEAFLGLGKKVGGGDGGLEVGGGDGGLLGDSGRLWSWDISGGMVEVSEVVGQRRGRTMERGCRRRRRRSEAGRWRQVEVEAPGCIVSTIGTIGVSWTVGSRRRAWALGRRSWSQEPRNSCYHSNRLVKTS